MKDGRLDAERACVARRRAGGDLRCRQPRALPSRRAQNAAVAAGSSSPCSSGSRAASYSPTAAGARRTESALARHVAAYELADVVTMRGFWVDGRETLDLERVERLPQVVASASRWARLAAIFRTRSGKPVLPDGNAGVGIGVWLDEHGGRERRPARSSSAGVRRDPAAPTRRSWTRRHSTRLGYEIGDTVQVRLVSHAALWGRPSAADRLIADPATGPDGPSCPGPDRRRGRDAARTVLPAMLMLRPAFYREHGGARLGALLRGRQCASATRIRGRACVRTRLPAASPVPTIPASSSRTTCDRADPGADPPAGARADACSRARGRGALLLFIAQAFARDGVLRAPEHATLQALGMPRRQIVDGRRVQGAAVVGSVRERAWPCRLRFCSRRWRRSAMRASLEPSPGARARCRRPRRRRDRCSSSRRRDRDGRRAAHRPAHGRASSSGPARAGGRRPRLRAARAPADRRLWRASCADPRQGHGRGARCDDPGRRRARGRCRRRVSDLLAKPLVLLSTPRLYGAGFDYLFWPEGRPAGRLPPAALAAHRPDDCGDRLRDERKRRGRRHSDGRRSAGGRKGLGRAGNRDRRSRSSRSRTRFSSARGRSRPSTAASATSSPCEPSERSECAS